MTVKFFAGIAAITRCESIQMESFRNVKELRSGLIAKWPALSEATFSIAVNKQIVHDEQHPIHEQDEIALLPPFSGG